jgi:hypothetical protein
MRFVYKLGNNLILGYSDTPLSVSEYSIPPRAIKVLRWTKPGLVKDYVGW